MVRRAEIAENSITLDEDLVDVDDQSSGISQGVSFVDPFINGGTIFEIITASAEISRTEDFSF